jgi:hypothetical protein
MAMTVKQLMRELEKIENKFLEVEFYSLDKKESVTPIARVAKVDKKVWIFGEGK